MHATGPEPRPPSTRGSRAARPVRRVLAIGGGGFLMESAPSPVDALLLELAGRGRPRVCFLPTPSGDLPEHIEAFYRAFGPRSCELSHLAFFRRPGAGSVALAGFEQHLAAQDAIYVGGGNTRSALAVWREWGADAALRRAYRVGVLLAGMSAGAMCWFEAGLTDSYWGAGYQPLRCLGLLPGGCGVHHRSEPGRRERLLAAVEAGTVPASVAIDDHAAVLYEDEVRARTFSWADGAGAVSISLQAGRIEEVPHECQRIGAGG